MLSPWILVSGLGGALLGALIGACVALGIHWSNRKVAAIERLLAVVYPLGDRSYFAPDHSNPSLIFHKHHTKLWGAYAALYAALPPWQRRGFEQAWHAYIRHTEYDKIPADEPAKVFHRPL